MVLAYFLAGQLIILSRVFKAWENFWNKNPYKLSFFPCSEIRCCCCRPFCMAFKLVICGLEVVFKLEITYHKKKEVPSFEFKSPPVILTLKNCTKKSLL